MTPENKKISDSFAFWKLICYNRKNAADIPDRPHFATKKKAIRRNL